MIRNLIFKGFPLQQFFFCSDKTIIPTKQHKNSISPARSQGYAYGAQFPKHWPIQYIHQILDPKKRDIKQIQPLNNKIGEASGKLLIKFKNEQVMERYIKRYNEDYIINDSQTHKIILRPFKLKTELSKLQKKQKNSKNAVKVEGLNYDMDENQVRKLAADFGTVVNISMTIKQDGRNRGFAFVYFQAKKQAEQFCVFIDGLKYRDRKFKGSLVKEGEKKKQQKTYLQIPTYTFLANLELMKKQTMKQIDP